MRIPILVLIFLSIGCGQRRANNSSPSALTAPAALINQAGPQAVTLPNTQPDQIAPSALPADLKALKEIPDSELDTFLEQYQPRGLVKPLHFAPGDRRASAPGADDYQHVWVDIFPNLSALPQTFKFYPPSESPSHIHLRSHDALKVTSAVDGRVLATGNIINVNLDKMPNSAQGSLHIGNQDIAFEDCQISSTNLKNPEATQMCWKEKNSAKEICYSYSGLLNLTRREFTSGASFVQVVNVLDLDDYLRGVVKSEIGADPKAMSALEAQAISARTYAIFHKIRSRFSHLFERTQFELFATEQSQLYLGLNGRSPVTDQAVTSTTGQVLMYDNQIINAEYHASSGGHTKSVSGVPYLKAVDDPGTVGKDRSGHGRGMSQLGALFYAKKWGWSALDILKHFYQGAEVKFLNALAKIKSA